ncbi:type ISP restriction/modification enzyme [Streptomyces sp. Ru73]|uniref:type ISP restriction/modification enzyme n=1 Tax=Streptomyces sp. Ru73 TaxID=2080748 RepID=UPI0015E36A8E|nr:type ISP restriction/modification enzyme [Streptomyces sp. Ru73]
MADSWLQRLVSEYGAECKDRIGKGDPEAAIRGPVERLLVAVGERWRLQPRLYPEVRRPELGVRPDYAMSANGRTAGYVELKRPEKDVTPGGLKGRDRKQWELMHQLPNVLYTNGRSWILYQGGPEPVRTVHFEGDLTRAGRRLRAPGPGGVEFEEMLRSFLLWYPQPIASVRQLVRYVAPLCQLLREEVVERLAEEERGSRGRCSRRPGPFTALAKDWEQVLFPGANVDRYERAFADRYAQTVTFALLLARVEDIPVSNRTLHEVGRQLGADHTVMGRALQILTDDVGERFGHCLNMLVRIVGAVNWAPIREREPNAHVDLYEHFLQAYDRDLRRRSGTYYTPKPLVEHMTRLADEVLRTNLHCPEGFADDRVTIVDPAMGTGTFLSEIIDLVADRRALRGDGFRGEAIEQLARRLIGFERQMGAYAVAQMRITQTLRQQDTHVRLRDLRLHLTDTLADPWQKGAVLDLGATYAPLVSNSAAADEIKRDWPVTVIIGNPPDREKAEGDGGWIEKGSPGRGRPLLDSFRLGGSNGAHEHKLKNLYVYFWRWATYKVFEQHKPEHQQGIVCFITTAGFLRGPGFQGMREYLRRMCSDGWIIDLSPEGMQPPVRTRIFPEVQQQLAIALFVRRPGVDTDEPAAIRYTALAGHRDEKYRKLADLGIRSEGWATVRSDWRSPFTPEAQTGWDEFPALGEIFPWKKPGVQANRTWVCGPDKEKLRERWERLLAEPEEAVQRVLFKETRDRGVGTVVDPLPTYPQRPLPIREETEECPDPVRVSYRAFDRQWIIPDNRLLDTPRPDLWAASIPNQLYVVEQHSQPINSGPALVFSPLLPDKHCFNSRGGRVLPLWHADGSPNVAPGLLQHLANSFGGLSVTADALAAYVAALTAHPAFTHRFVDELNTPGVRVPLTADRALWQEAVALGRRVIWAATFGERCADESDGRPVGGDGIWASAEPHIEYVIPVGRDQLPTRVDYDASDRTLHIGSGVFTSVTERMRHYEVGGDNVLDRWLSRRSGRPAGRRGSPLDDIRTTEWQPAWSHELQEILAALRHLTDLEPAQAQLLERVLASPLITVQELCRRRILVVPPQAAKRRPVPRPEDMLPGLEGIDGQTPHAVQPIEVRPDAGETGATPRRHHHKERHPDQHS